MDKNALTKVVTHYDVESITNRSKKLFRNEFVAYDLQGPFFVSSCQFFYNSAPQNKKSPK